jgi:TPR repeat protein
LHLEPDEMATLLKRSEEALKNGDVSAARLLLRRAAFGGSASAAVALGATYDPLVIHQIGAVGAIANTAKAREWYKKAAQLGSPVASQRLEQLAQTGR